MIDPGEVRAAAEDLGWELPRLYLAYFGFGGNESLAVLETFLGSGQGLSRLEFNKLAAAVNDTYVGRGQNHPVHYDEA
jgi:hypothetical protein